MPKPARGKISVVDLGMTAKVRLCLLITDFFNDDELVLVTLIPHTIAVRGTLWEVCIPKPYLKDDAFHCH